jgi:hypothetical protein
MKGIKHMVECHCVLPQFRHRPNPPFHKFIVFSVIDDGDTTIEKHSKCNNCGIIHNVFDVGKSQIMTGQEEGAVIEINDIELMIPRSVSDILHNYNCDVPVWEHVLFILQNAEWDTNIILSRESDNGIVSGRILKIISHGNYQIQPYSMKEVL